VNDQALPFIMANDRKVTTADSLEPLADGNFCSARSRLWKAVRTGNVIEADYGVFGGVEEGFARENPIRLPSLSAC
jgi:hypothetical protein